MFCIADTRYTSLIRDFVGGLITSPAGLDRSAPKLALPIFQPTRGPTRPVQLCELWGAMFARHFLFKKPLEGVTRG